MSWWRPDFPGQDAGILNDDWVLGKILDLEDFTKNKFLGLLTEYMQNFFEGAFVDCLYIPETKTIKLCFKKCDGGNNND